MRTHRVSLPLTAVLLLFVLGGGATFAQEPAQDELFPQIEPFDSGHLKVSDLHEIYYEQSGNREGKAIFFLHGGPGGSTSPAQRRYYDPKKFRIVLHDQRGAGRSRPFAEIRQNTTWDLVEDIEKLRQHLKIDKMILLGGSWGSTLAVAYAEKYPERVSGLILRGVYLGTREEMQRFYVDGVREYFPEVSDRLWSQVPEKLSQGPAEVEALDHRIRGPLRQRARHPRRSGQGRPRVRVAGRRQASPATAGARDGAPHRPAPPAGARGGPPPGAGAPAWRLPPGPPAWTDPCFRRAPAG